MGKDGKTELKLAYHLPVDHHLSKSMEKFAKRVEEKSGGKLTVKTYPAGQLYTDKSMNDAIMSGGLDMGLNSTAMWTTVIPALNVLDVPFLLPNYDSVAKAIDGGLGKTLEAEFELTDEELQQAIDALQAKEAGGEQLTLQPSDGLQTE